ncbi:transcriptional regulator [Lentzea sp. NBC_00516]|uniref:helix-turn-helix domain-containing protein n=1 Tax=Lentzea sp. NBC_00516 TaxID=2903582 RepID=UPI002E806AD5|nr:transcriptional regulator [Lentzea sp. NBC_00516]WUD21300.1 transcriptional regulator [Lentzea sp. NBC_00516]
MADDWGAVARAINQRMTELGMNQRELTERSQVSKAIVGELQNNTVQRRRSDRTLEALSVALDWHPNHLGAVLGGRIPPQVGEPVARDDDVLGRLAVIEHQLREITAALGGIDALADQVREIDKNVKNLTGNLGIDRKQPGR